MTGTGDPPAGITMMTTSRNVAMTKSAAIQHGLVGNRRATSPEASAETTGNTPVFTMPSTATSWLGMP